MTLSFRNKLFLSFLIIIFLCITAMITNQILQFQMNKLLDSLSTERSKMIQIQEILNLGIGMDDNGAWYLLVPKDQIQNKYLTFYRQEVQEINNKLESLNTISYTIEEKNNLRLFEKEWVKDLNTNEQAFYYFKVGDYIKAQTLYTTIPFSETIKGLTSYRDREKEIILLKQHEIQFRKTIIFWTNITISAIDIILCTSISWMLSNKIELEQYIRLQTQMFQNTSHELKTPLMSIRGYAEGILDGIFKGEKIKHALKIIIDESNRLTKSVTEMILLSKLENERNIFNLEVISLEKLIQRSIDNINPLVIDRRVNIITTFPNNSKTIFIKVDEGKLLQSFINILSNALRYAKNKVEINVFEMKSMVDIEIKDDGPGISKDIMPYIFQRFVKGKDGETGLGLAISRAIIEGCHGKVNAYNRPSGGAVISIRFNKY